MIPSQDVIHGPDLTTGLPAAGDVTAVYAHYARPLLRFILHRIGDPAVAEDLLQDVFVRMLVGLPQYEERGYPVSTWLYRIAACRVVDWLRVNGRRRMTSLDLALELPDGDWPDGEATAADREAEQRLIAAALAQLTKRQAKEAQSAKRRTQNGYAMVVAARCRKRFALCALRFTFRSPYHPAGAA